MCIGQILQIDCAWKGQPPFAKQDFNYHHKLVGPTRADIKPLNIVQPEGPSFSVSSSPTGLLRQAPCSIVLPISGPLGDLMPSTALHLIDEILMYECSIRLLLWPVVSLVAGSTWP